MGTRKVSLAQVERSSRRRVDISRWSMGSLGWCSKASFTPMDIGSRMGSTYLLALWSGMGSLFSSTSGFHDSSSILVSQLIWAVSDGTLGRDGWLANVAECIPLVGYLITSLHRRRGHQVMPTPFPGPTLSSLSFLLTVFHRTKRYAPWHTAQARTLW